MQIITWLYQLLQYPIICFCRDWNYLITGVYFKLKIGIICKHAAMYAMVLTMASTVLQANVRDRESENESDCVSDQRAALEEQKTQLVSILKCAKTVLYCIKYIRSYSPLNSRPTTCPNARRTVDSSAFSATARSATVGASTRTPARTFPARPSRTHAPTARWTQRGLWRAARSRRSTSSCVSWKISCGSR